MQASMSSSSSNGPIAYDICDSTSTISSNSRSTSPSTSSSDDQLSPSSSRHTSPSPTQQNAVTNYRDVMVGFTRRYANCENEPRQRWTHQLVCLPFECARTHGTRGKLKGFGAASRCFKQVWSAGGAG